MMMKKKKRKKKGEMGEIYIRHGRKQVNYSRKKKKTRGATVIPRKLRTKERLRSHLKGQTDRKDRP